MSSRIGRAVHLSLAILLASACSKAAPDGSGGQSREESASPDISPTAAPGVAFNYDYSFNLPDGKISAAQEAHAAACEKLGLARCRITGMSYSLNQQDNVTAELELKLDPAIARQFGKAAQQTVEGNDGKLLRLDIGSSDEGSKIASASAQSSNAGSQIATLQEQLRRTKAEDARARILDQIQNLEGQKSEQAQIVNMSQATLASTPMHFRYYGEGGVPGFRANPVREAWKTFMTTVIWLVGMVLQALAVLVPLGVLLALVIAIWRTRPVRAIRGWARAAEE